MKRAERFGIAHPELEDAKKRQRAERFGVVDPKLKMELRKEKFKPLTPAPAALSDDQEARKKVRGRCRASTLLIDKTCLVSAATGYRCSGSQRATDQQVDLTVFLTWISAVFLLAGRCVAAATPSRGHQQQAISAVLQIGTGVEACLCLLHASHQRRRSSFPCCVCRPVLNASALRRRHLQAQRPMQRVLPACFLCGNGNSSKASCPCMAQGSWMG